MLNKNQIIELSISGFTSEGMGVGRYENIAVFVPMAAAGDIIEARIVKVLKNYCFAIIEKIIQPSQQRIEADCPVFKRCGGCDFRHISYESELIHKTQRVNDCLKRISGIPVETQLAISTGKPNRYRNKAIYPIRMNEGKLLVGFFAKRSHDIIECSDCLLHKEFFNDIVQAIKEYITQNNVSVYDEEKYEGLVRSIYIRHAEESNQVMVCLVINGKELPNSDSLISLLTALDINITSVVLNINTEKTNILLGKKCVTLFGNDYISDILCGVKFDISPLSFYQVNRNGAEILYGIAREFAQLTGNEVLFDLYCGAGTIGLSMAKNAKKVIGIDIVEPAIENAKFNALNNKIENAQFICADVAEAVLELKNQQINPDVVILDPPRKGCEKTLIDTVVEMSPDRIVMVSCDPSTAARDIAIFEKSGYKVIKVQAVDMFCRTHHIECVVLMSRVAYSLD